jgi:hypothetical protein
MALASTYLLWPRDTPDDDDVTAEERMTDPRAADC